MPTCFVIQPFDSGKFDKRYVDIYRPALEQAGLEPYRVDGDPSIQVTIDAIEDGIRTAAMCMADITTDNPNVWYELGFSLAIGRDVIIVCSDERKSRYPFDIQHRNIVQYGTGSPSDYEDLQRKITDRAQALLKKSEALRIIESERVAPQDGLSQIELIVLAVAAGSTSFPGEPTPAYSLKKDAESSGLTRVGYGVAIARLQKRGFVAAVWGEDEYGERMVRTVTLTDSAWSWMATNERLFTLSKDESRDDDFLEDIPF